MIPSSVSNNCCCEEEQTQTSTPTSGISGTFGCSGSNVACLTITNGVVTNATNRAIGDGATGSAGCSELNVPCLTVAGGYVTAISERTLVIPPPGTLDASAGSTGLNVPSITVVDGVVTALSDRTLTIPPPGSLNATAGSSGLNVPNIVVSNGVVTSLQDRTLAINPSNLTQQGASNNQVLTWGGTQWQPASIPAPGNLNGTAGASGLDVASIGVTNGVVTSLTNRTLSISPSNLNSQGATNNQVIAWNGSQWAPATISSAKYRADFLFVDFTGYSYGINLSSNDVAFQDNTDYVVFRTEFVPTNFTLGMFCVSCNGNTAGNVGFKVQQSVDLANWYDVSGSTLNVNNTTSSFKYTSSSVSIGGSPSAVYWRLKYVNTTSGDAGLSFKNMYLSLWN